MTANVNMHSEHQLTNQQLLLATLRA